MVKEGEEVKQEDFGKVRNDLIERIKSNSDWPVSDWVDACISLGMDMVDDRVVLLRENLRVTEDYWKVQKNRTDVVIGLSLAEKLFNKIFGSVE